MERAELKPAAAGSGREMCMVSIHLALLKCHAKENQGLNACSLFGHVSINQTLSDIRQASGKGSPVKC